MSDTCPTVRVRPWGQEQGDHVVINEADFDPAVHTLLDAEQEPAQRPAGPDAGEPAQKPAGPDAGEPAAKPAEAHAESHRRRKGHGS